MTALRQFFMGHKSVSFWTVVSGIAGLLSFLLAGALAFKGTSAAQERGPGAAPSVTVSYSPTPTPSISASPSPSPVLVDPAGNPISESPVASDPNKNPSKQFLLDMEFASGGYSSRDPVTFNDKAYDRTVSVYCGSEPKAWSVVGYNHFTATLGVDDHAEQAIGTVINASFTNQDNQALGAAESISLGKPRVVSFPLKGAVQMQLSCRARGNNPGVYLSLGNAAVTR